MKILKSVFAVLFVATLFSSCAEEDYVTPKADIIDSPLEDGEGPRKPGTATPPTD